jgi:hypothetical protein
MGGTTSSSQPKEKEDILNINKSAKRLKKLSSLESKYNVVGRVCTWLYSNEEDQNRCKSIDKWIDTAASAAATTATCSAAVLGDAAAVPTGGLSLPAGVVATGACIYNFGKMVDNAHAASEQLVTGQETETWSDQLKDSLMGAPGS